MKNIQEFYQWERATRDTIDVKKIYIDLAGGDLVAGVLLSQIIFWHLPDRENKSKLSIFKDSRWWIAKGREDWWDEIRISPKQFDRAVKVLEDKGLIISHVYLYGGKTIKHISLNENVLLIEINRQLEEKSGFTQRSNPESPESENPDLSKGKNWIYPNVKSGFTQRSNPEFPESENQDLPKGKNRIYPNVKSGFTLSGNSNTEITSEITEENTAKIIYPSINQSADDRQTDDYPEELKTIMSKAELEAFDDGVRSILAYAIEDLYFDKGSANITAYPLSVVRSRMLGICYPVLRRAWNNYCTIKLNSGISKHKSYLIKCIWSALTESSMDMESNRLMQPDITDYTPIIRQIDSYLEANVDLRGIEKIDDYPGLPFGRKLHSKTGSELVIYWDRKHERISLDILKSINSN